MTDNARHFTASFQCPKCGHIIDVMTWMAIVEGPGLEIGCIGCRTLFLVTLNGATPITDTDLRELSFVDAEGNPYDVG